MTHPAASDVPTRSAHRVGHRRARRRLLWRRIRALLAGGLVLGVGAGVTLATWNDGEYTAATFTAGKFGIVGSTTGAEPFTDHNSSTTPAAAALSFAISGGQLAAMVPGNTAYALFSVKTISPSVAGAVLLQADPANNAGLGAYLTYRVRTIPGTTCDATTFGNAGPSADVVAGAGSTDVPLTTGAASQVVQVVNANGGNQVNYCFAVTLPSAADNGAQGKSLAAKWTFLATAS